MLFSCHGLFDSQKIESKQEGPFVVTGRISNSMDSSASGARTASSSKNELEKFWYKVTATPSEPTLEVKETIVSSKDYSFVLDKGTWTFNVKAYLVATSDEITDSTIPILVSNNLEYNINSSSVTLPSIELKMNTAANATGTFSLPIDVTDTGIESCKVEFTNILDGIKPDGFIANADTVSETGREIITLQPGSNISAGYYLMRMEFYSGSDGTGIRLYSRTEMITIYPGASSTSYVVKWNNENNLLEITASLIEGNRNHEVYVNSSASDSGSGGFFDPFKTFTQAMDYINTVNDGNDANIDYSIILCNDITGAPASGSDTFITIEPHHPINLTIKSKPESEIYKIQPTESSRGISFKGVDGGACLFTLQNVAITGYGTSTDNTAPLGAYVYENATVQLTGATYIDYIAVENDAPVIKIPSELEKIYKTADNKYSIEETDNTLLKNFIYVPQTSYAEDKQYLSGDGLATSYMNIGIKDQQLDDSKKQKWEFLSTGYIQKFFLYAKNLTSIPAAGDTVYIKDAADLYALQTLVNSGYLLNADGSKKILSSSGISFENVTFEQLEDIDLTTNDNTNNWVPIGKTYSTLVSTSYPFSGNYAGNNKKINILMSYSSETELTLGLFGCVKNGSVKDITISGSITTDVDSTVKLAAGVVSYLEGGTVDGCVNDVAISINEAVQGAKIGGIVADAMPGSKITNCISNQSVSVINANTTVCMGGIAGSAYGTLIDNVKNESIVMCSSESDVTAEAGGIVGYLSISQIYNSINRETVTLQSDGHAGGIVGSLYGKENKIYNCYNEKYVYSSNGYSAGIVGYAAINQSQTSVDIQNCVSYEDFNVNNPKKSGIINLVNSTVSDPDSIGTISNCYWYIPSGITLEMKGPDGSGTTVENCSSFTLNSPADEWYGTLASPVTAGEKTGIKALVYALNSWVDYANKTPLVSDVTFKNVCFDETNGLEFGAPPEGEPPAAPTGSLSSDFSDSIQSLNTGGTIVYVKTAEDLKAFAALVNSGSYGKDSATLKVTDKTFTGITVEQTADIDLTDLYDESFTSWIPIGTTEGFTTKWFNGTYNGNGNQISNLNINATTDIAPALFGNVQNGTIQNVIVSGSVVSSSGDYVAGVVNCLVSGTLENCVSNVNVKNTSAYTTSITGGIVASVKGGSKVLNCTNNGSIENTGNSNFAGGIAGVSDSTSTNLFINCKNNGSVITSSTDISSSTGGIISTNKGQLNIFNCINYGKIETKNNAGYGGGILGANRTESYRVNIYNCVNNASVNNFSGNYGIIGYIQANSTIYVKYCYNNSSKVSELFYTTSSITSEGNQNTSFTEGYEESIVTELNANISKFSDLYGYEYFHNWAYESAKGLYFVEDSVTPPAGTTLSALTEKPVAGDTVYISEAADLLALANFVNTGINGDVNWGNPYAFENVNIIQSETIDLTGITWKPIGEDELFSGKYDGSGYSINNITIDNTSKYPSFFGYSSEAEIKNLTLQGTMTVDSITAGGFSAVAQYCVYENCINNIEILASESSNVGDFNYYYIGGIIGTTESSSENTIKSCMNNAKISIDGYYRGAGGLVGAVVSGSTIRILNCVNKGEVKYTGSAASKWEAYVAGFVSDIDEGRDYMLSSAEICNSCNKGKISSSSGDSGSAMYCSGFIGKVSDYAECYIENCFNANSVSGANYNTAFVGKDFTGSNLNVSYCYWDKISYGYGVESWKLNTSESDSVNNIYTVAVDSDYYTGKFGTSSYEYLKPYLQQWVEENNTESLYQDWSLASGGNEVRGQGEPVLPIEQTP